MISHLALIMDGNRRWAKKRSLFPWQGHKKGADAVETAIAFCMKKGISYLSLYTFSLENVHRSDTEKKYLFKLMDTMRDRVQEFIDQNIKIRFVGDRSVMSDHIKKVCADIESQTAHCTKLQCNFLFFYGGRQEIIFAAQQLQNKNIPITEESLRQHLWTGDIPDPDLILRTGGYHRLSNFLLFQSAYSQIRFIDTLWPDITEGELDKELTWYMSIKQNKGK